MFIQFFLTILVSLMVDAPYLYLNLNLFKKKTMAIIAKIFKVGCSTIRLRLMDYGWKTENIATDLNQLYKYKPKQFEFGMAVDIRKMSWLCDDLVWDFTSEKRVSV